MTLKEQIQEINDACAYLLKKRVFLIFNDGFTDCNERFIYSKTIDHLAYQSRLLLNATYQDLCENKIVSEYAILKQTYKDVFCDFIRLVHSSVDLFSNIFKIYGFDLFRSFKIFNLETDQLSDIFDLYKQYLLEEHLKNERDELAKHVAPPSTQATRRRI